MFYILMVGIAMAALSATAWCYEALIFVNAVKSIPKPLKPGIMGINEIKRSLDIIAQTPKLIPLGLDIICTIWLTGAFGFTGMIGGVIGLTISNVLSVFIIYVAKRKPPPNEREGA